MAYAPVPAWQIQELQRLSLGGMLSGVSAETLSVIDAEESSGQGGGINSSGYGGYFGLGQDSQYPTGHTTPGLLADPSTSSFDVQAQIAAGEFASLLERNNNDPLAAENAYQGYAPNGAPGPGASLFEQYGITGPGGNATASPFLVSPSEAATLTSASNGSPSDTVWGNLGPWQVKTPYGYLSRAVLLLVGVFLVYLGIKEFTQSDHSATDTIVIGGRNAGRSVKSMIPKSKPAPKAAPAPKAKAEKPAPAAKPQRRASNMGAPHKVINNRLAHYGEAGAA